MFVLVDAEDRENEGDLVIPAQMATPETVNFMAKYGRGLICLSMNSDRAKQLNLELMSSNNQSRHQTAFTVSIEAREGITTGISAHDRAHTIAVAIDPTKGATDIVSPGHVFPLVARDGGVLVRAGHTEAAVDIARLAGLYPAGVICEIMNDDGTMARLPDLVQFAQLHGLKIATIADLIAYRRRHDNLIHRAIETEIESEYGGTFNLNVYLNTAEYAEHIALTMGDLSTPDPVLVRMHAINVFDDMLGAKGGRNSIIEDSMRTIAKEGRGVIVLIRDTTATVVSDMLLHKGESEEQGPRRLREYGVALGKWCDACCQRHGNSLMSGKHILIVEARFYEDLADELARGAIAEIEAQGGTYERVSVPGVLEIPAAVKVASDASRAGGLDQAYDGYVTLGVVIRGETTHYDIVSNESARALMDLTITDKIALGNGIQTVENSDQAWARANVSDKNKGRSAARLAAVQALYQMDVAQTDLEDVIEEFVHHRFGREVEGELYHEAEEAHFDDVVRGVVREQKAIDVRINDALAEGWVLARLDSTLRATLRAGGYELQRNKDIPAKVVINEYLDIANAFFENDEPKVVNAVLDRIARQIRSQEFGQASA
eukprot:s1_g167.t1